MPGAAIQAHAAVERGIDDDSRSCGKRGVRARFHHADHFVAHDQRVAHRDRAFVNVQIGAADSAVSDANENLVVPKGRTLDFREAQLARAAENHGSH